MTSPNAAERHRWDTPSGDHGQYVGDEVCLNHCGAMVSNGQGDCPAPAPPAVRNVLDRLDAVLAEMTPEPWQTHHDGSVRICHPDKTLPGTCIAVAEAEILKKPRSLAAADATGIALMHTALPALVAAVRAAGALRQAQEAMRTYTIEDGIPQPFLDAIAESEYLLDAALDRVAALEVGE